LARGVRVGRETGKPPWVIVVSCLAALVSLFVAGCKPATSPVPEGPRAAIVDQLYASYPNEDFTARVTAELTDYGFEVYLYQGDITVDLYRDLPGYGYDLIVFRVHSGLIGTDPQEVASGVGTYLFTNEPYNQIDHLQEQLNAEVQRAKVAEGSSSVFAVGPGFITGRTKGSFDDSVIIVNGCSCLYSNDLAQAFIDKGASVYLAWNATVGLGHVDEATVSLIKNLCSEGLTVKRAVSLTMATEGADPETQAILKYYPRSSGSKTIAELMGERE